MKRKPRLINAVEEAINIPEATPACLSEIHKLNTERSLIAGKIEEIQSNPQAYFARINQINQNNPSLPTEIQEAIINAVNSKDKQAFLQAIKQNIALNAQKNENAGNTNAENIASGPISFLVQLSEIYFDNDFLLERIIETTIVHKASDDLIRAIENSPNRTSKKRISEKFADYILRNPDQCGNTQISTAIHLMGETGHSKKDLLTLCALIMASASANLFHTIAPLLTANLGDPDIFTTYAQMTLKFGDKKQQQALITQLSEKLENKKAKPSAEIVRIYSCLKRQDAKHSAGEAGKILAHIRQFVKDTPEILVEYALQATRSNNLEAFNDAMKKLSESKNPEHLLVMSKLGRTQFRDDYYDLILHKLEHHLSKDIRFAMEYAKIVLQSNYHGNLREFAATQLRRYPDSYASVKNLINKLDPVASEKASEKPHEKAPEKASDQTITLPRKLNPLLSTNKSQTPIVNNTNGEPVEPSGENEKKKITKPRYIKNNQRIRAKRA